MVAASVAAWADSQVVLWAGSKADETVGRWGDSKAGPMAQLRRARENECDERPTTCSTMYCAYLLDGCSDGWLEGNSDGC